MIKNFGMGCVKALILMLYLMITAAIIPLAIVGYIAAEAINIIRRLMDYFEECWGRL